VVLALIGTAWAEEGVETVAVPMRDGVRLATDIYRSGTAPKGPVVLMRTPYNKAGQKGIGRRWAAEGFTFVVQDCRGTFASEGAFAPYNNEGQDGYDTLEWIVAQPWCNGRVGMTGGSYVGAVQWQAAVEGAPGLAAIIPEATWTSFYRNLYLGGAVRLKLIAGWMKGNSPQPEGVKPADLDPAMRRLPLSEVDAGIGWEMPWLDAFLMHPRPDGFWTRFELKPRLPELTLPALHIVGYYDFFSRESVDGFLVMQRQARDPETRRQQRLILGPWDHGTIGKSKVAAVDFGPAAAPDLFAERRDWFRRHLDQDPAAGAKPFAAVRYFSMGDNVWHDADTWPPAGVTDTAFFLHSRAGANGRDGDGRLSREQPAESRADDTFQADPADPAPSSPVTEKRPIQAGDWGPVNQSAGVDRPDILVFTSEPLAAPLSFAGNPRVELRVSADTPDADWAVKLIDVRPDGFAQVLARGIIRGRYRDSLLEPSLLEPGKVYAVTVDLGPVAATLAAGHRLRVDVSGADYPLFDRNPNTAAGIFGTDAAVATQKVHHGPEGWSRLVLPVK
jgi:putative CocE/NonD family hydrolase